MFLWTHTHMYWLYLYSQLYEINTPVWIWKGEKGQIVWWGKWKLLKKLNKKVGPLPGIEPGTVAGSIFCKCV